MNKMSLNRNKFYIDKTEELQKGIEGFPFVYIEGFAACGKSTAVNMLLEKYPEVERCIIDMHVTDNAEALADILGTVRNQMQGKAVWVIFENMNEVMSEEMRKVFQRFLQALPEEARVIFVGRERPDECLLPFLWERKMEMIPQEALLLSRTEIQTLVAETNCSLDADEIYEQSGGWAGCADMMLRLAKWHKKYRGEIPTARELRKSYEIEQYTQCTILGALREEEKHFLDKVICCPWVNEKLCEEIFDIKNAETYLQLIGRKGILQYDVHRRNWKAAGAFKPLPERKGSDIWAKLSKWYVKEGYIREASLCIKNAGEESSYLDFLQNHYDKIALLDIPEEVLLAKKRNTPQMSYLQGVYCYLHQDFPGIDREIARLEKMNVADTFTKQEILLNLHYLKPDVTMQQWLDLLAQYGEISVSGQKRFHLYHMLGYAHTYLCGLRDLSALFAGSRKEENKNAKIWKTFLGEKEWQCYQLAKIDYYLETERREKITEEEWAALYKREDRQTERDIVRLYLAGKLMRINPSDENEEYFLYLSEKLKGMADDANVIKSIIRLYSQWIKRTPQMSYWFRNSGNMNRMDISEQNYIELCFMVKGYLQFNQFGKTERIIAKLIPYLQKYHRTRLLAEIMFQQSVINWKMERHGQALQNVIASFMAGTNFRYVNFYSDYGQTGKEVLESYEEWYCTNFPEKWHRKKKYQYGNVLRMPEEDYIGVILRMARKGQSVRKLQERRTVTERRDGDIIKARRSGEDIVTVEHLTMMETMVLQAIGRGCSNAEICKELNLKLPTVKTHIYNLYRKLGVNSRVQAVNRGKELGYGKE